MTPRIGLNSVITCIDCGQRIKIDIVHSTDPYYPLFCKCMNCFGVMIQDSEDSSFRRISDEEFEKIIKTVPEKLALLIEYGRHRES